MLSSLDLSFTRLTTDDWEQLTAAMNENASLTFLDMRQWPAAADSVLGELGSCLLDDSRPFALRFVRCDVFDILEGESTLSLEERALGGGAIRMLAGVLMHNATMLEVDLSATGVSQEGATALASALRFNTKLTTLSLLHNPLEEVGAAQIEEMGDERRARGHPLEILM